MSLALGVAAMVPTASSQPPSDTAERLVLSTDGGFPNAEIVDGRFSADGQWFVFSSLATNLVDSAPSGFSEVYALETATGDVRLLTQIPEGGGSSDGDSFEPVVCGDGSVVAFVTEAELLDPSIDDDFNGEFDVYVIYRDYDGDDVYDEFDTAGGVRITRAGVGLEGTEADFGSFSPAISDDCSTVAFTAVDPLADNDLNDNDDVYVRDITSLPEDVFDFDGVELVSVVADPTAVNAGGGQLPSLSADGSKVAFISVGGGLVTGPDAGKGGVFLRDRTTETTQHVSVRASGGASSGAPDPSRAPSMTPDGSCVAFKFLALDLAPGVVNNQGVFVRNITEGSTTLVSKSNFGVQAIEAGAPSISPDCRFVGFDSGDSGLVAEDDNGSRDAFVHDLVTGGTDAISRKADGTVANGNSSIGQLVDGRGAVVVSSAPELGGADGGSGIADPFAVQFGNLGFATAGFNDVAPTAFFEQGTAWLKFHDITTGTNQAGTLYSPLATVNRVQMALFMWRMMGEPVPTQSPCGFTDMVGRPAEQVVATCWLKQAGVTTGTNQAGTLYGPNGLVTRGQMAGFLHRLAGLPPASAACGFNDEASIPAPFRQGACWLKANGITTNNPYNPSGNVNRGQMAAFLYRLASTEAAWNGTVAPPLTVTFPVG
jgi:Tol biopolymer transport system component